MKPTRLPAKTKSYPAQRADFRVDRTGATYQVQIGNLSGSGAWGLYLFRTPKNGKPEQLFFAPDANGGLQVINRKLWLSYCDKDWIQWAAEVPGYIDPDDKPSSNVVDINTSELDVYKQQVALAQNTANQALNVSNSTKNQVSAMASDITALKKQVATLTSQVNNLQSQILNKQQIEDIVWSKIWDVNYLIRMGFLQGKSTIREVQDYLNDLAVYIRNITK
jgi:hypothetical protein